MAPLTRIVLTGPESSGKTTLAKALSAEFGAAWTPEAARLYAESSPAPLSANTVEPIARLSIALEDEAINSGATLIVRDTDLLSTVVYARHYYGNVAPWITEAARARLADLYLLCLPDLPWEADGVRDRPEHRDELLAAFRAVLAEFGAKSAEVRGAGAARLECARRALAARIGEI